MTPEKQGLLGRAGVSVAQSPSFSSSKHQAISRFCPCCRANRLGVKLPSKACIRCYNRGWVAGLPGAVTYRLGAHTPPGCSIIRQACQKTPFEGYTSRTDPGVALLWLWLCCGGFSRIYFSTTKSGFFAVKYYPVTCRGNKPGAHLNSE